MLRHSNTAVALSIFQSNLVTYAKVAGGWKPLGRILGVPATSFSAWKRGLGVPELEKASSLAWYGSIGLVDLFERKLNESEIQLRIISNPLRNTRQYRQSNKDKTIDQFINLLDTRIKAQPYDKISAKQILIEIGLGPGNKLSRNEVFLQRLIAHNQTVRKFRRIAAVWIAYTDLRAATIKVAESGRRLERNIISKKMHVPYRLLIPRNRQIHRRLMALVNQGRPLPEPSSRFQSKIQAYLSSNKPIEAIH